MLTLARTLAGIKMYPFPLTRLYSRNLLNKEEKRIVPPTVLEKTVLSVGATMNDTIIGTIVGFSGLVMKGILSIPLLPYMGMTPYSPAPNPFDRNRVLTRIIFYPLVIELGLLTLRKVIERIAERRKVDESTKKFLTSFGARVASSAISAKLTLLSGGSGSFALVTALTSFFVPFNIDSYDEGGFYSSYISHVAYFFLAYNIVAKTSNNLLNEL